MENVNFDRYLDTTPEEYIKYDNKVISAKRNKTKVVTSFEEYQNNLNVLSRVQDLSKEEIQELSNPFTRFIYLADEIYYLGCNPYTTIWEYFHADSNSIEKKELKVFITSIKKLFLTYNYKHLSLQDFIKTYCGIRGLAFQYFIDSVMRTFFKFDNTLILVSYGVCYPANIHNLQAYIFNTFNYKEENDNIIKELLYLLEKNNESILQYIDSSKINYINYRFDSQYITRQPQFYSLTYSKTTGDFQPLVNSSYYLTYPQITIIPFCIKNNCKEEDIYRTLYILVNGTKSIFNSFALFFADIYYLNYKTNRFNIFLIREDSKEVLRGFFNELDHNFIYFNSLTDLINSKTTDMYKNVFYPRRALIVTDLENISIKKRRKLEILITRKKIRFSQSVSKDHIKIVSYKLIAPIIAITSDKALANTYKTYNSNIIDLTHLQSIPLIKNTYGLRQWFLIHWVLYGVHHSNTLNQTKQNVQKNYVKSLLTNNQKTLVENEIPIFAQKYLVQSENKDSFVYKSDLYEKFSEYIISKHNLDKLPFKQNGVTTRFNNALINLGLRYFEGKPHLPNVPNEGAFISLNFNDELYNNGSCQGSCHIFLKL